MIVAGIDPGVSVGYAVIQNGTLRGSEIFDTRTSEGASAFVQELLNLAPMNALDSVHLAIEDFVGFGMRSPEMVHTIKWLGFAQYFGMFLQFEVKLQPPQLRKYKLSEATKMGVSGHAKDALAHALAYYDRHGR